jgi:hypothetical protein
LAFLVVALSITVAAQASFNGLTPGKSTRPEVERLLGKPVKEHSQTLIEYSPQRATGRIFVQYAPDTAVVERFEFLCRTPTTTCAELTRLLKLPLSDMAFWTASYADDSSGKTVRYYGAPVYLAITVDNESEGSFYSLSPARVALYSAELYKTAVDATEDEDKRDRPQLAVRSLRFFESGQDSLPFEERVYHRRFAGEGTRWVNYEITLAYPKAKLGRPISITCVWSRDGPMQPIRQVLDNNYDSAATYRIYNRGLGRVDGRGFAERKGKWKAEIYVEGQLVATGTFEIY